MSDNLTVLGPDGIRRSYDEHYDTMMDVEQDPTGAHQAIQRQHDRIEELEAENRLLRDAVYIDDLTVTMQANDRSKAMTVIRRALDFLNADMPTEAKTALRTTLAELTGAKDE